MGDAVPASTLLADGMRFSARLAVALEQLSVDDMFTQDELLERLRKVGEVLGLDKDASAFLMAEFRLNRMLGDVYKILAEAIDVDLSALEG